MFSSCAPLGMSCGDFPGPGQSRHFAVELDPIREFVHHYDAHVEEGFELFKKEHNKDYKPQEHEPRKHIFRQNLRFVSYRNLLVSVFLWALGVAQFVMVLSCFKNYTFCSHCACLGVIFHTVLNLRTFHTSWINVENFTFLSLMRKFYFSFMNEEISLLFCGWNCVNMLPTIN